MRLILNLIWLILCGWWMAILYFLAGIVAFILIITIPFGIAAFRIASYVLWPFGRSVQMRRDFGIASLIGNIIWIVLLGWELALGHLTAGILLCITIIGIPLGLANFKLIPISLIPLGVRIVPSDEIYPGYRALARAVTLAHGGDGEPGRGVRDHGHFRRAAQGGRAQALRDVRRGQARGGEALLHRGRVGRVRARRQGRRV
jgi:uncharacterized membrane protein YccF (DUF307 family)